MFAVKEITKKLLFIYCFAIFHISMSIKHYIGIDLGTTTCKCRLYNKNGFVSGFAQEYPLIAYDGFVEQDANLWWDLVRLGIKSVCREADVSEIEAVSISTQGISVVPVDKAGAPLMNSVNWLDARPVEATEQINQAFGADYIYNNTGKKIAPCYTLPKIMWLKRYRPEIVKATHLMLMPLDFLNMKLSGKAVTDYTMASGTMIFDINRRVWSKEIANKFEVSLDILPEVKPMGTLIGILLPEVSAELGLKEGTKLIQGGQDQKISNYALGLSKGLATVSLGTATAVSILGKVEDRRFAAFALNDEDIIMEASIGTTGAAVKWLRDTLGIQDYKAMDKIAEEAGSSAGVIFQPDFVDGAPLLNLKLETTQGNIIYALLEGISRSIFNLIDGHNINKLLVCGGGANSKLWIKILKNITKTEVQSLGDVETATLGAAKLASGGLVNLKTGEIKC